ncbi:nitric oxide reductase transcriptional regulator NorR [Yersinia aleksiciae]|uniref:Putative hydrogenlyase transcriptional activator n=1 Tax=Yersinia aleksiciae TaxID=263819 RepID=A0A0T9T7S2_YERAE|nr:nitric oxide reductase transcriptional regulator NorR [Yersinia aleksiciae]MDA5498321.1 nitric oxide reductase transcriptional regulator NorR [Yersinia aleksiciae]NIK99194.1 nitric oxide reductase transcriptional regulator NorR [Yersinia aleksiciae]WQC72580.1 nitric oxide reductase transcriptional regulator NorR [Yersinia aleksiciae]CFQ45633.1 putative hydrogenlyase transcriptional activator [Yersinia aleksiciae]CNK66804.1 putative hydrogenlyase transcriptional activator [Yersinia aleksicia
MSLSIQSLAKIAIELQSGLSGQDRFQTLISSLRQLLQCDASALLRYEHQLFRPLAIDGLSPDVLGRRFSLSSHPRLEAIARAGNVVRFPTDSHLPDPYDGLIPGHDELKVHACIGLPLFADQTLIGALTFDSMNPQQFDGFNDEELKLISALASSALNNALLVDALEKQALPTVSSLNIQKQNVQHAEDEMIGLSPLVLQLKHEIGVVAGSELNVLITGETGVGKELVAKAIHHLSPRSAKALIYLNCAALPENVAESELFGHVKGAFTGAIHDRTGKFEIADNGTLFLDEIGELSLVLQAKLLRVIQYGDLQRVGDDSTKRVNVRIIAATNCDLKQAVIEGRFRVDLFHRLSVFPLHVPPLRERKGDIVLLAGFFVERIRKKLGLNQLGIPAATLGMLENHSWLGNVRELEHAIYRAAVLARASQQGAESYSLQADLFNISATATGSVPLAILSNDQGLTSVDLPSATRDFQRQLISKTLEENGMNWSACARALTLDSGNLHRLAKRLGIKH